MAANNDSDAALLTSTASGDMKEIRRLLKTGIDINAPTASGMTVLHVAARSGQMEAVELLVENGAKVDGRDKFGKTPLHCAARLGHQEIVSLLIDNGANVNAQLAMLAAYMHLGAGERYRAEVCAKKLKTAAGADDLHRAFAAYVLTGKRPAAKGPTTRPAGGKQGG